MVTVFVCTECPTGAERLAKVQKALRGQPCRVQGNACLSGCRSGASVALRASGRMAYLFGPLQPEDMAFLPVLIGEYLAAPRGEILDARPLGSLRLRVLARIPACRED
ncbi:DUF1636 family protein [Gemmobacter serpentinus]|uniref:DUF1636 family protein n=1 Tax=Gemmobacter serpentinus TaxID=2652247 RepID=UPI0018657F80|nr:DUF1636 family protein [Gemmobacter serpentinus]